MIFTKIVFLILGLAFFFILIFFMQLYFLQKTIKKTIKTKPNHYSKIRIDTKKKIVYMTPIKNNSNIGEETYSLDDFIYMISITPDSKNLRELFKLIVNERSSNLIKDKLLTLTDPILFTFERTGEKKSYASFFSNCSIENMDNLYFEMAETFINGRDKEIKIFKNEVSLINDEKIFNSLYKDIKELKSKGWVVVKISHKNKSFMTQKERKVRILDSNKVKSILETNGIISYISKDFSIFATFPPGKVTNNILSQKHFNVYVNSLLSPTKEIKQRIDVEKFIISTIYDTNKSTLSLNFNLIKLQLISELKSKNEYKDEIYSSIFEETKIISDSSRDILESFKKKETLIDYQEITTIEKSGVIFNEYFLDVDKKIANKILVYSWKDKNKIVREIISYVNNKAKKTPKKCSFFSFDILLINEVIEATNNIKRNSNFMLMLEGSDNSFDKIFIKEKIDILRERGYEVILKPSSLNREDINKLMFFKPKYILFSKKFSYDLGNEWIAINSFKKIMKNKSKHTKIFTTK